MLIHSELFGKINMPSLLLVPPNVTKLIFTSHVFFTVQFATCSANKRKGSVTFGMLSACELKADKKSVFE